MNNNTLTDSACFIVLEGIEGVGKTTHGQFIQQYLKQQGIDLVYTREPGGTPLAEAIRTLVLQKNSESLTPISELLLVSAARAQHVAQIITPALRAQRWVLCDRFTDSTYAYQGAGRGIAKEKIAQIEKLIPNLIQPNHIILFDMPVEEALARRKKQSQLDRIEAQYRDFFERVRACYIQRAKMYTHYSIIDATESIADIQINLMRILDHLIRDK